MYIYSPDLVRTADDRDTNRPIGCGVSNDAGGHVISHMDQVLWQGAGEPGPLCPLPAGHGTGCIASQSRREAGATGKRRDAKRSRGEAIQGLKLKT